MLASAIVKKDKSIGQKQNSNFFFYSILKFRYSEKATKIWKKSQYLNFQVHYKKNLLLFFVMTFIKISTYQFCINSLLIYILLDIFIEINSFSFSHSLFSFFFNYLKAKLDQINEWLAFGKEWSWTKSKFHGQLLNSTFYVRGWKLAQFCWVTERTKNILSM